MLIIDTAPLTDRFPGVCICTSLFYIDYFFFEDRDLVLSFILLFGISLFGRLLNILTSFVVSFGGEFFPDRTLDSVFDLDRDLDLTVRS